jgi:preprotein translocase subunit SecD
MLAAVAAGFVAVATLGYAAWGTTSVLAAVRFEIRLAEEQPAPGLVVAGLSDTAKLIYLHPEIVVSNDDIAQSWVSEDAPNQFSVVVDLLPSGAARLQQATAAHLGRPVALLLDGRVVMAPTVRAPIGASAVITGNFTRAEAEKTAQGMAR